MSQSGIPISIPISTSATSSEESMTNNNKRLRSHSIELTVDQDSRKKQVIEGWIYSGRKIKTNILIITDNWPTFAIELKPSTLDSELWIHAPNCPAYLKSSVPKSTHWTSLVLASQLIEEDRVDVVILQGNLKYCDKLLQGRMVEILLKGITTLVITPEGRTRKFASINRLIKSWRRINHVKVGGLTTSRWLIGSSKVGSEKSIPENSILCKTLGLKRRLVDVVKDTTTGGVVVDSPDKPMPTHVSLSQGSLCRPLVLPSVFSCTGWVRRKLSVKEIGALFDFSELFIARLNENQGTAVEWSIEATPLKIVQIARTIMDYTIGALSKEMKPVTRSTSVKLLVQPASIATANTANLLEVKNISFLKAYGNKAAKDDDAGIPVELWNSYLFIKHIPDVQYDPTVHGPALEVLRNKFGFRFYIRSVTKSFFNYIKTEYGNDWMRRYFTTRLSLQKGRKRKRTPIVSDIKCFNDTTFYEIQSDLEIGLDALMRVMKGSWWEWNDGSTLLFWRWPKEIRKWARDGVPVFVQGKLPRWKHKQRLPSSKDKAEQMKKKLMKSVNRRYISDGSVSSLINCFAVDKGTDDIRLVYDGTKSLLNLATWAPNFFLPSIDSMLMSVTTDSWFADLDLGEMFLNYFMCQAIRQYSGVDLTEVMKSGKTEWKRWNRIFMGFRPSPYIACKLFGWSVDIILGDRWSSKNPFKWNGMAANFPGAQNYNPAKPRLCKMWNEDIAAVIEVYVDDIRSIGFSESNCRDATRRASQLLQYLGQQDATRKYRPPHTRPGPRSGSFVAIKDNSVWVYVSQDKWDKAKKFVLELSELLKDTSEINHKFLERGKGFLVYFCRTYTSFVPFLKGFHLTCDSWREGRDNEGWKIKRKIEKSESSKFDILCESYSDDGQDFLEQDACNAKDPLPPITMEESLSLSRTKNTNDPPRYVTAVSRLRDDVSVLSTFLDQEIAPWRFIRGDRIGVVQYGFGDAAKAGFGASFEDRDGSLWYRLGVWGKDEEEESSNYRELKNLVEALESRGESGMLGGMELFFFTDNSTAEATYYKGSSSSKKLFKLIVRLRNLELSQGCKIHLIHVAGTRMIHQGTDGLSRGDIGEGVMKGDAMLNYIPLHLSAIERSDTLKQQIINCIGAGDKSVHIEFLNYENWFIRGHDIIGGKMNADKVWIPRYKAGTFIWTPPPAGGLIAVEQLRRARLKRENSTHIMIIPRLMSPEWKRQLFKVSDLYVELPFDESWDQASQHEPLVFAVLFPFLSHRPWQLKRAPAILGMAGILRRVWQSEHISSWIVLRQLFIQQRKLGSLSESVVWKMLQSPHAFGVLYPPGRERGEFSLEKEG